MINVLIIDLGRDYGGAEKVIENLFFYDYSNINMHLVALKDTKFFNVIKSKNNNQNCIFIENDKKKILNSLFKLKKYIEDNKIDIIHAHGVTSEIFGVLLSKMTKCKLVTTIHSRADFDTTNKIKGKVYCWIQKYLLNFNERYIVVSDELEKFFINNLNVKKEKLIFIKNGLKGLIKREKQEHENLVICSIGRLTAVKAHNKLLKSLLSLNNDGYDLKCLIAGTGELENELKKQVDEYNLKEKVEFLGFIEDVRDVFDKSDCLIIQSDMEGLPVILLEAMSYKIPIIAYKVGGIKKLLKENQCIELKSNEPTDISDGIKQALNKDREELDLIANEAFFNFKKNYDLSIFIKKHEDLYNEVKGGINE
ncbi:glycosyltransferase [Clostridium perfringens]|nr:glycosyltransferase [Clostridium perfringens]